jgi:hypothetical protein
MASLPSRTSADPAFTTPTILTNPMNPTYQSDQSNSYDYGTSFGGIKDPQALAALSTLIAQLQAGQTPGQKQLAERNNEITRTREISRDYSKGAAFLDAENAVNQALRKAQEANMPAIVKAIQGAGTSSSSMQGLLAQRLATESAQAAGALGAKQAVDYGQISLGLQGVLEALTRPNDPGTDNLLKALGLMKVDTMSKSAQTTKTGSSSGGGGGGSYIANTGSGGSSGSGGTLYSGGEASYYSGGGNSFSSGGYSSPSNNYSDTYGGTYNDYSSSYGSAYDNGSYGDLQFVSTPSSSSSSGSFGLGNDYFSSDWGF